jgi:predicted transport protein
MSTIGQQIATQIANIEKSSGRSLDEWIGIVRESGLEKHGQILAMLKERGLTHGNANLVAIKAREAASGGSLSDDQLIASHYTGKNEALRPLYDDVVARVRTFGSDIELDPKKTYVSLRRRKQFGQVGPAAGQLEVCVNLPGREPTARLKATSGMATHKVRISDASEIDDELVGWLREAYEQS